MPSNILANVIRQGFRQSNWRKKLSANFAVILKSKLETTYKPNFCNNIRIISICKLCTNLIRESKNRGVKNPRPEGLWLSPEEIEWAWGRKEAARGHGETARRRLEVRGRKSEIGEKRWQG
jgi:hypothetical protein